jgi:hypothetical protein
MPENSPGQEISMPGQLKSVDLDNTHINGSNVKTITFRLTASSVVLSTNAFGDFSKCTIVSENLAHEDSVQFAETARNLWLYFVHQPQTARCLVFLLGVGMMCKMLEKHYKEATKHFSSVVDFRVSTNR